MHGTLIWIWYGNTEYKLYRYCLWTIPLYQTIYLNFITALQYYCIRNCSFDILIIIREHKTPQNLPREYIESLIAVLNITLFLIAKYKGNEKTFSHWIKSITLKMFIQT